MARNMTIPEMISKILRPALSTTRIDTKKLFLRDYSFLCRYLNGFTGCCNELDHTNNVWSKMLIDGDSGGAKNCHRVENHDVHAGPWQLILREGGNQTLKCENRSQKESNANANSPLLENHENHRNEEGMQNFLLPKSALFIEVVWPLKIDIEKYLYFSKLPYTYLVVRYRSMYKINLGRTRDNVW